MTANPDTQFTDAHLLVSTTVPDAETARTLARTLVGRRLVACAQCLPGMTSHYWWQDTLEESGECLILMKTTRERLEELVAALRSLHPYQVPQIVATPIVAGLGAYLDWIRKETRLSPARE